MVVVVSTERIWSKSRNPADLEMKKATEKGFNLTIHLDSTHEPKSITPLSPTARSDQILLAPFHNVMFDLVGGRQRSRVARCKSSFATHLVESRDKIILLKSPNTLLAQRAIEATGRVQSDVFKKSTFDV